MQISPHFHRHEFACRCGCGFDTVDAELLTVLQSVRDHFKAPVTITSGCRCVSWNRESGGRPQSMHLLGRAADIITVSPLHAVYVWLCKQYPFRLGLGLYPSFIHIDTRTGPCARWTP